MMTLSRPLRGNIAEESVRELVTNAHKLLRLAEPHIISSDINLLVQELSYAVFDLVEYFNTDSFKPNPLNNKKRLVIQRYIKLEHLLGYYYPDIHNISYWRARTSMLSKKVIEATRIIMSDYSSYPIDTVSEFMSYEYDIITEKFNAGKSGYIPDAELMTIAANRLSKLKE